MRPATHVRDHWRAVGLLAALFIGLRVLFTIWSGGAWMGHFRFLTPTLPLIYLLVGGACTAILEKVVRFRPAAWRSALAYGAILAPLLVLNYNRSQEALPHRLSYGRGLAAAHIKLGRELRERCSPTESLACGDAGALPYYSGLTTLDLFGLNDAYLAHLTGPFYQKFDAAYVLDRQPTYVVLVSSCPRKKGIKPHWLADHDLFFHPQFHRRYVYWREYRFSDVYYLHVYVRQDRPSAPRQALVTGIR
jgi:hypothetical protein